MPADSMTDQNFHEIQLSGKQLVFVFMSAVVVAVVIFLLGVSVGRGVRNAVPSGTDVSAAPASVPTGSAAPPSGAKQANPGDLTYHEVLQGKAPASGASAQPPAPAPVAETPPPAVVAARPTAPPPAETKSGESAKGAAADSKAGAKGAPPSTAASGWFVQVNTFSTKENAEKQVQQLKAKSFTAFVFTPVGPLTRFHVRLGPFQQRPDAERMAARLVKEGFTPLITR
jgi:cell division protein FtsN